jgi:uncharacterized protein YcbK (DUF882 family)
MAFAKTHLVLQMAVCKSLPGDCFLAQLNVVSSLLCSKVVKKFVPSGVALAGLVLLTMPVQAKAPHLKPAHMKIKPAAFSHAAVLGPGTVAADDNDIPETGKKYSLKLYSLHTNESIDVVYRIGDVYLPDGLDQLNHFLRDHYTDDVKQYDPAEFDLLHNVLTRLNKPAGTINILCGYRTEETNEYLRSLAPVTGVAEHSQHIQAKAIDIRVPGVQTARLRDAAMSLDAGGVGYYPRAQFVHVDVGPVRHWTYAPVVHRKGKKSGHAKHRA